MTGEDATHVSGCWEMRTLCVYHEGECLKENGKRKRKGDARLIFSSSSGERKKRSHSKLHTPSAGTEQATSTKIPTLHGYKNR
jgi:hypothetical protein